MCFFLLHFIFLFCFKIIVYGNLRVTLVDKVVASLSFSDGTRESPQSDSSPPSPSCRVSLWLVWHCPQFFLIYFFCSSACTAEIVSCAVAPVSNRHVRLAGGAPIIIDATAMGQPSNADGGNKNDYKIPRLHN